MVTTIVAALLCTASLLLYSTLVLHRPLPRLPTELGPALRGVTATLEITQDGSSISVSGTSPGPLLVFESGQTVEIQVINRLQEPTSVHWHGIRQWGTNYMDGVPGVTECAIPANRTFTYRFLLDRTGTFWYHGHNRLQRLKGLYGGLVVLDGQRRSVGPPYYSKPTDDTSGAHAELHASSSAQLENTIRPHDDVTGVVLVLSEEYDSIDQAYNYYMDRDSGNQEPMPLNILVNGKSEGLELELDPSGLVRFIHAGAYASIIAYITAGDKVKRPLTVVSADGTAVEPLNLNYLALSPGQRYDILIEGVNPEEGLKLHIELDLDCFAFDNEPIEMVIDLDSSRVPRRPLSLQSIEPTVKELKPSGCLPTDPRVLRSFLPAPDPDAQITLYVRMLQLESNLLSPYGYINRTSYKQSRYPILYSYLANDMNGTVESDNKLVYSIPLSTTVELVINNPDDNAHTFHLHGHRFFVLHTYSSHIGVGYFSPSDTAFFNTINPAYIDTHTVPARGHSIIRFVADNPGIWAFHCHMAWHSINGMVMQFAVAPQYYLSRIPAQQVQFCHT
ncbi:hypothetical protein TRVA0_010S01882 [Trichomonascus vanleenenianus]|uniref:multicopper oxidase family protein n=1 Tax=Trichomonascus vanleenenianus TaxID=2268995 RepID=UPI003EC9B83D